MLNIQIRDRMMEVLQLAYPDLYDKYKKFMLLTVAKETKKSSSYNFKTKTIKISSLSRTPGDIFISALCELGRHIDVINREETHLDHDYCVILKKLLMEAVNGNIINKESLKKYSDQNIKNKLQEYHHNFDNWIFEVNVEPKYIYIYVFEAFMLKNILKTSGYIYDSQQALWYKKIYADDTIEEYAFTEQYKNKAIFKIIGDNSFFIRPVYMIKLKTYAKSEASLLQALEYYYDKKNACWKKIIAASNIEQELDSIKHIPQQSLVIMANK